MSPRNDTDRPISDSLGFGWRYEHDAQGRDRVITDALGVRTELIYDTLGRLVAVIDRNGRAGGSFAWDRSAPLNRVTQPTRFANLTYDRSAPPRDRHPDYRYDPFNCCRPRITDPLQTVTTEYSDGRRVSGNEVPTISEEGHYKINTYEYDHGFQYRYDPLDGGRAVTHRLGKSWYFEYDRPTRPSGAGGLGFDAGVYRAPAGQGDTSPEDEDIAPPGRESGPGRPPIGASGRASDRSGPTRAHPGRQP